MTMTTSYFFILSCRHQRSSQRRSSSSFWWMIFPNSSTLSKLYLNMTHAHYRGGCLKTGWKRISEHPTLVISIIMIAGRVLPRHDENNDNCGWLNLNTYVIVVWWKLRWTSVALFSLFLMTPKEGTCSGSYTVSNLLVDSFVSSRLWQYPTEEKKQKHYYYHHHHH